MKTINLKDILSISGKGGLFKYIAQARNGIVVESVEEGKRHVAPSTARISSLEDIAIFTTEEELPLSDIFYRIHEQTGGGKTISHKSPAQELKDYFGELVPDYDPERVYISDIKKVFQWYNQLREHEMLEVTDKTESGEEQEESSEKEQEPSENKEESSEKEQDPPENGIPQAD